MGQKNGNMSNELVLNFKRLFVINMKVNREGFYLRLHLASVSSNMFKCNSDPHHSPFNLSPKFSTY